MVYDGVAELLPEAVIAFPLISAEQGAFHVLNDARHDIVLTADGASDRGFAGPGRSAALTALIDLLVLREASKSSSALRAAMSVHFHEILGISLPV